MVHVLRAFAKRDVMTNALHYGDNLAVLREMF